MKINLIKTQQGFVALMTVLIILAVGIVIGVSLGMGTLIQMKNALGKTQSLKASYLANLCAEYALIKLKGNPGYLGNEILNMGDGSCTIFPTEGNWTIKVSANSSNQIRKLKIIVDHINPRMAITSWEEVSEL
jgi:hypothetical protein